MKHAKTRALYDYWNSLRDGRLAPYRSEVDPREIAPLLDSTFILEIQSPESVRFRLAGTRLCENFGMELRGMSALALWHGECRSKVRDMIRKVSTEPCIGEVSCTVENRGGFLYKAEFLYMPLRSDMGDMNRILGCGYYMGEDAAFASLYDPIHHWVDTVELFQVEGEESEEEKILRTPFGRRSSDVERLGAEIRKRRQMDSPALTTIEGGLPRKKAYEDEEPRSRRGHLRLVKSDVG